MQENLAPRRVYARQGVTNAELRAARYAAKVKASRRAKNKRARQSRQINRRR